VVESGRARLNEGARCRVPIEVRKAGLYRLDLLRSGRTLTARLEDAGRLADHQDPAGVATRAPAGRGTLSSRGPARQTVDTRVVARLRQSRTDKTPEGLAASASRSPRHAKFQGDEPGGRDGREVRPLGIRALRGRQT